ncbi:type IV pilin protein [Psychromonas hadalis]|uniref:type IV pilin protein n=1 Tax=Psychromonas hadalis TaxID=211669 RepID=UPI0003B35117|nr:type IV pilin protein [Psychromonas hadalis]
MKIKAGFTLIELLVVIAIIGILGSIAYPSFQSHMLKARRGDAKAELIKAQMKQTSLHILGNYSSSLTTVGLSASTDYYDFRIYSVSANTYSIEAKAISTAMQNNDTGCTTLTTDQDSNQTPPDCW